MGTTQIKQTINSTQENSNNDLWFSSLLKDIDLSTTKFITGNYPDTKFLVLNQETNDTHVFRKIAFSLGGRIICEATNKVERNDIVDAWIKENPDEPFGRVFQGRNIQRTLVSTTKNSRKFSLKGEVNAEIEEKFYPLVDDTQ